MLQEAADKTVELFLKVSILGLKMQYRKTCALTVHGSFKHPSCSMPWINVQCNIYPAFLLLLPTDHLVHAIYIYIAQAGVMYVNVCIRHTPVNVAMFVRCNVWCAMMIPSKNIEVG